MYCQIVCKPDLVMHWYGASTPAPRISAFCPELSAAHVPLYGWSLPTQWGEMFHCKTLGSWAPSLSRLPFLVYSWARLNRPQT